GGFALASAKASQLFMNQLGRQMAAARGAAAGTTRVALAEACATACDANAHSPSWSAWFNGVGALGRASGDGNTHTSTYSIGGMAGGADYRIDPQLLVGLGVGYTKTSLWLDGLTGSGASDGLQVALYGSFSAGAAYVDGLAGYAYSSNMLQRPIAIAGLQPRTATGSPQTNQLFGQLEGGWRFELDKATATSLTPFARWQAWTGMQAAFSEWGANSINLNVAQQNTTSVRSVLGADLSGTADLGRVGRLALQLRLGWAHEYADVAYPVTASFAGAPFAPFTVTGATLPRDSAIVGLLAQAGLGDGASLYLRYDGEVGSGFNAHALTLGVRMSW
ncbi:MAG TPA: autotransporter outer membrane beta-barrel domain-containing protein, partial [Reyranella sp.]|nr:autotransporter outer membrane beta-barrel domain-containing protein [Reyranella sp.]